MSENQGEITLLLKNAQEGDKDSYDKLMTLLYDELQQLAKLELSKENKNHTLIPAALIHELYEKLLHQKKIGGHNRVSFRALCARAIRQILVDWIRKKHAVRRGKDYQRETLTKLYGYAEPLRPEYLLALDEAISRLALVDEASEQVVVLRYFSGCTIQETADHLKLTYNQVRAKWNFAKHWLHQELTE